ncbi:hypothetical protein UFOVP1333_47 [uncultured Caudovirales phage]|uniref:Uncharacterized protein n=1 Tax=uncultured Caudovirales phage TaxID=2100421 RepID=A0A6J5RZR7_9CAUD|nr:hypothetical protein UFOVP1333_47 [uncultured Caudovirales phage]
MRWPTKAEWIGAGRWCKDHAPAFTVVFVTFSALWFAVALCCLTLYVFDASFYRGLAPPGMELWFQFIGVCFRTVVIFGGLAIVWGKSNKLPSSALSTLRFLFVMSFCAVMVSALGYVSEGGDYHARKAGAAVQTETVTVESADARLARIDTEKAAVRADRDRLVTGARESMRLVLSDGIGGNDNLTAFEAQIAAYENDARTKLSALDEQVKAIEGERLTARQTATENAVGDPGLATVYRFPERYIPGWSGITARDTFNVFWVILLESIGAFGAQSLLSMQMALSKRKQAQAAGALGGKTTARRTRVRGKLKAIEDLRAEKAATASDLTEELEPLEDDDLTEDADDEDDEPEVPKQAAE